MLIDCGIQRASWFLFVRRKKVVELDERWSLSSEKDLQRLANNNCYGAQVRGCCHEKRVTHL